MSEGDDNAVPAAAASGDATAGAMLRAAREKRGLHIAALAASIKVSPRKLEALESDRYGELPDLTFTRALAQTMCRALKIDAEPVLARLPRAGDMPKLAQVGGSINAPLRNPHGQRDSGAGLLARRPVFWATSSAESAISAAIPARAEAPSPRRSASSTIQWFGIDRIR